jgi:ribonuclease D
MGKNRRRRNKKYYHHRSSNQDDVGGNNLSEVELILVKKFLSDYRSLAYDIAFHRSDGVLRSDAKALVVGEHVFPSLTEDLCSRPYIDLPETLSAKDRHKIHALCCHSLDLYHAGIGHKRKRRIVVSIYADGFRFIPDEDSELSLSSYTGAHKFPYMMCTPWYYLDKDTTAKRRSEIEHEKQLIHQFVKYPEQTLIRSSYETVRPAEMEVLDLSSVPSVEDTPYELIDTVAKLKLCVDELRYGVGHNNTNNRTTTLSEIAFDMEMYNQGNAVRTCLIQLTSNTIQKDYIIDPLAVGVWDAIGVHLSPLFSDPSILKIGHGIGGMDCSSLHRDFGILVVNAFDTCEASALVRQSKGGLNLASLCEHYGLQTWEHYRDLKDRFQTTNWCKRPLSASAVEYGRYDVRYLITLRKLLMRDLLKMDMTNSVSIGFDDVSDCDSTSMSESTAGQFVSSSSRWSSVSESSFANNSGHPTEKGNTMMSAEAIISVSDLPSFEKFMKAISISQKRCLKLWAGKAEGESESILQNQSFISMIKQSANNEKQRGAYNWTEKNTKLYTELAGWRKTVAARENVDVNDVCSLDLLCWVSYKLPKNRSELRRFEYVLPALIEDKSLPYFDEMKKIISSIHVTSASSDNNGRKDAVFYSFGKKVREDVETIFGRRERKLLIATTVLCLVTVILTKRKR